ncbi:hypothetical protein MYBA111488_24235 [Mycobacterium basiliense]
MQYKAGGLAELFTSQSDFGEQLVAKSPHRTHALEGGPVAKPGFGEAIVQRVDWDRLCLGRRPLCRQPLKFRVIMITAGAKHPGAMPNPLSVFVNIRTRVNTESTPAVLVGSAQQELRLHRHAFGYYQRRFQYQFL